MTRSSSRPSTRTRLLAGAALLVTAGALTAAPAWAGASGTAVLPVVTGDGLRVSPASAGWVFTSTAGRTQDRPLRGVGLWRDGVATAELTVPVMPGRALLSVTVGADRCLGGADMAVRVDGQPVLARVVDADHEVVPLPVTLPAGPHTVAVSYSGDVATDSCDRALKVYAVSTWAPGTSLLERVTLGPPGLLLSDQAAGLWHDLPGGSAETVLWRNAALTRTVTLPALAHAQVVVTAAGDECEGWPSYDTWVDGRLLGRSVADMPVGGWTGAGLPVGALAAGPHTVRVAFVDDLLTPTCDRNLNVRRVTVLG